MSTPSYIEDHISQIPALQLLMKMGYKYLSPDEVFELRGQRTGNVILEPILRKQLDEINDIEYKDKSFKFSDANISLAINELKDLPVQDGYISANESFYDLITLGKSLEQNVLGDKKSFTFNFIDWKNPEKNSYHVTEEFSVARSGRNDHYRPDIVIFINGIPMLVIECKSPGIKKPLEEAVSQHMRNQQEDGIRDLYLYSNILMSLAVNQASYATTGSSKEFWNVWKEIFRTKEEGLKYADTLKLLKNTPLPEDERTMIFKQRFYNVLKHFNTLEQEEILVTEQDKLLFSICRKDRLLDIILNYIVYDDGVKKISRYQQYFAIKETLKKISIKDNKGKRTGGVIWHTQGSGKSLTMVMLAQLIAADKSVKNHKIILVTDRIDLDDQITKTFQKCQVPVVNAQTGKHLVELIKDPSDAVITTIINKFEAAIRQEKEGFDSSEIFVLIDEGHRSQYGTFNVKMQKTFPNACFIAFTGTPLMKKEKSTALKFGGIIGEPYTIVDAVEDKAVVPILYEGRHNLIEVNEKPLDNYFDKISESLTQYGKAQLKRKYSTTNQISQADQIIYARAWDISDHFVTNFQNTGFKGMLVTPNKTSAIRYREYLKEIGKVSCEVLISPDDTREGNDDAYEENEEAVKKFYKSMLNKYGNTKKYEKAIINSFKKNDDPEIIIVVDKLLTGFDAPVAQVLYLTRSLKEHTLLQAVARVNRVAPGKDFGYIIDYYGNLENLDTALNTYSGLQDFDEEELAGTVININQEIAKLAQAHSDVWEVFKTIKNKYDAEAYSELLSDESIRHQFYEKLSLFVRLFKMAMSTVQFNDVSNEKLIDRYKKDAHFFLKLRVDVTRRFFDSIDYKEYEPQIRKLIDKHITTEGEILKITELVNIFNKEERESEVEKIFGKAAKADHIAARTISAINLKMNDDSVFYKKLSELIKQAIADYRQHRIEEAEYLQKVKDYENQFYSGKQSGIPSVLENRPIATAYYNVLDTVTKEVFKNLDNHKEIEAQLSIDLEDEIKSVIFENGHLIVDWHNNTEIENELKIRLDDFLFESQGKYDVSIPFNEMDLIIEEVIKIAKNRYK